MEHRGAKDNTATNMKERRQLEKIQVEEFIHDHSHKNTITLNAYPNFILIKNENSFIDRSQTGLFRLAIPINDNHVPGLYNEVHENSMSRMNNYDKGDLDPTLNRLPVYLIMYRNTSLKITDIRPLFLTQHDETGNMKYLMFSFGKFEIGSGTDYENDVVADLSFLNEGMEPINIINKKFIEEY